MNSARAWLLAYCLAVLAATLVHDQRWLGVALVAALIACGPVRWLLLRRTLLSLLMFNLAVSAGYAAVALWRGDFHGDYLLLLNLRVALLVFLGFWFVARVDFLQALRGWPLLTLLATLTLGQMRVFARIVGDFRLAFASRNLTRPRLADRAHNAAAQGQTLLDKSLASASEAALAMRSRGTFDD
jgi:cobalt/nickel transport system permease protein